MVSFIKMPNIHRGDLAQQSLWLRLGLIPLFSVVAIWVSGPHDLVIGSILVYVASSCLLALGYRGKFLGSTDVIYVGMVDTSLFLGAGVLLTGGAQSPVLPLFFGMQAAYLVLARPKVFIVASAIAAVAIIAAIAGSILELVPAGIGPEHQPMAQVVAAVGALAMLAGVGYRHSVAYVVRSQAKQHLNAALNAFRRMVQTGRDDQKLASTLSNLMTTLKITDEGAIYRFCPDSGTLKLEVGLGLKPWIQSFPEFLPEEGPIGDVFQKNRRLICQGRKELGPHLKNLTRVNSGILSGLLKGHIPPLYTAAVPVRWQSQALGVLMLSRQDDVLDDSEVQLMEGFADHIASTMHYSALTEQVARLDALSSMYRQLEKLRTSIDTPGFGLPEFVQQLGEAIPFHCARVLTISDEGIEPGLTYYWHSNQSDAGLPVLDAYLKELLEKQPSGAAYIGHVEGSSSQKPDGAFTPVIPAELAEQSVGCLLATIAESPRSDGSQLRSVLALMHHDADAYTEESTELVQAAGTYLASLINMTAASLHLEKTREQVDALCSLVNLSHGGSDEDQVAKSLMQGASRLLGDSPWVSISSILVDEEKGAITGVLLNRASPEQFQPLAAAEHSAYLKKLFQEWGEPQPKAFGADSAEGSEMRELVGVAEDGNLLCFPLHVPVHVPVHDSVHDSVHGSGKSFGALAINLPLEHRPTQLEQALIQRVADVGALCLQNSRRYEAQARRIREFQQEDELRRSFLSYITHEFRTPLASLKTSFELIQEAEAVRGLDDPYQRLLTNVNRSVAILGQLISDMSEVANISAGGVVLNKTSISPEVIVYPVVEITSPLSHLKGQTLEVELQPDLPKLMADAHRLEQVLTNMVSNAIKYTPQGGSIKTVVSQQNGCIQFAISDTGRGIPQEDLDKVFDPFYRVPLQSSDRTPGTGLGLALAKSLVELHGGEIWVESEMEKGSTFYFTVPIDTKN